jgi:CBS domain-containing protein
MICPSCGYVNLPGADLCASCENSLAEAEAARRATTVLEEGIQSDPLAVLDPVEPITVEPTARVRDVIRLLADHNIGCVLVVFCGAPVGIFSERDALMRIGDRLDELADHPIRHFMTPAPETLAPEDSIAFALNRMALCDFRHIPIEAGERAVGIISVHDVLRYTAQQFPEILTPDY